MRSLALSTLLALFAACSTVPAFGSETPPSPGDQPKVLRYAFRVAETGFDPAQITDLYSRTIS